MSFPLNSSFFCRFFICVYILKHILVAKFQSCFCFEVKKMCVCVCVRENGESIWYEKNIAFYFFVVYGQEITNNNVGVGLSIRKISFFSITKRSILMRLISLYQLCFRAIVKVFLVPWRCSGRKVKFWKCSLQSVWNIVLVLVGKRFMFCKIDKIIIKQDQILINQSLAIIVHIWINELKK